MTVSITISIIVSFTTLTHGYVFSRESPESRDLVDPVVSVDPPDPWDPLAWPEPLARVDARYGKTKHTRHASTVFGSTITSVRIYSNHCQDPLL